MKGFKNFFKGSKLKQTIREAESKIDEVRQYDALYKRFAEKLGVIDKPDINFQGDEMKLDLDTFRKSTWKKKMSKKEAESVLADIVAKSSKAADMLRKHSQNSIVNTVATDILIQTRESEKYKAMVDSAVKKSHVVNEEDFWDRTVRKAMSEHDITDKAGFTQMLNQKLRDAGYEGWQ